MPTFIELASVGGTATSYTISGISNTYKDLCLIGAAQSNSAGFEDTLLITTNSGNFQTQGISGQNDGTMDTRFNGNRSTMNSLLTGLGAGSGVMAAQWFYFIDYANTTYDKMIINQAGLSGQSTAQGRYLNQIFRNLNTGAISSLTISNSSGTNFTTNTNFRLYGMASS